MTRTHGRAGTSLRAATIAAPVFLAPAAPAQSLSLLPFVVSTGYVSGQPVLVTGNGIPVVTSATYQPYGGLASYTTGDATSHDVTTTIAPDPWLMPRPRRISTSGANAGFDTGVFSYDAAGNVLSMGNDSFGYDPLSRLTSASLYGVGSQGYTYDIYGNLLSRTGTNPFSLSVNASTNQIAGTFYDALGNLNTPPGETVYYDPLSGATTAIVGSVTWRYYYTGAGERVLKNSSVAGNTFTFRDPENRNTTEYAGTTASTDNVFLGSLLVSSYANLAVSGNGTAPWVYYSSDHLGTPRLLTDVMGNTVETRRSWPFGEDATTPSTVQRLRFATMERDLEGQRYYDHARPHSFGLARFLSPDKLGGHVGDPQSWNRYAYARNNPIRYYDPNGREVADGVQLRKDRDYALATGGPEGLASFDRASMQGLKYGLLAVGAAASYGLTAEYGPALIEMGRRFLARFGAALEAPRSVGAEGIIEARSSIGENPYAVRLAESMSQAAQRNVDSLLTQFRAGNMNPGLGTRALGDGFFELRGASAGRVIVKQVSEGVYDIVGKFQGHALGENANSEVIKRLINDYAGLH